MAFLKVKEVSQVLRCSNQTTMSLIRKGKLKAIQIGGRARIDSVDFQHFLQDNYCSATETATPEAVTENKSDEATN